MGIIGSDDRKPLDSVAPPWNAVGKVHAPRHRAVQSCTGILIAPDRVVTAAHCAVNPRTRKPIPANGLNFVAGLRRDTWLAGTRAKCIKSLSVLEWREGTFANFRTDVAVLVLDKPLAIEPVALASGTAVSTGALVSHAGYGRDRPFLLSLHAGCRILQRDAHLLATDCDTASGQSGGPVFVEEGGMTKLAAVMVGGGGKASLAVAVDAWRGLAEDAECEASP